MITDEFGVVAKYSTAARHRLAVDLKGDYKKAAHLLPSGKAGGRLPLTFRGIVSQKNGYDGID